MAADGPPRNTVPDRPSVTLVVAVLDDSGNPTARHTLTGRRILVGRGSGNDVVLDDGTVSARHARIDVERDGVFVTDLGSTNGTRLDGRRVTGSTPLSVGAELVLGTCRLRVEVARRAAGDRTGDDRAGTVGTSAGDPAAAGGSVIPARHRRRVLVSFDAADTDVAVAIVDRLERVGHEVMARPGTTAEGWGGRLLDTVWRCDVAVFVVSAASAASEKVHREVHLAGAERTPVIPVLAGDTVLPPDLAYYLERREPVDLRRDPDAGLSELQRRLDEMPAKKLARPRRLLAVVLVAAVLISLVGLAAALVL